MNIVYYSIVGHPHYYNQWVQSIRSLRHFNTQIPVYLFYYGPLDWAIRQEADRHRVVLMDMGDYGQSFASYGNRQLAYTHFKTLHKLRHLRLLPAADQVLFLDCDTFFFEDVEHLFARYRQADFYAREEVMSRRNHHGYNPDWIEEDILAEVAANCGARFVPPYNTGACLMNHQSWLKIADHYSHFLNLAWRLAVGAHLKHDPDLACVRDHISDLDRRMAIHNYPTSSTWIFEEVATWLTLGLISGLTDDAMDRRDVIQGGETDPMPPYPVILAHYWSNGETKFFNQVVKY